MQQDGHLQRRHVDNVGLVEVAQLDVPVRKVVQPGQLPPRELLAVEGLVHLDRLLELLGDVERRRLLGQRPRAL